MKILSIAVAIVFAINGANEKKICETLPSKICGFMGYMENSIYGFM
jgi:hypothetical protein